MPVLFELFAGSMAVSKAFAKLGWKCYCVDLREPAEVPYNCHFIKADVLTLGAWTLGCSLWTTSGDLFLNCFPDFIWASSPCEEFSTLRNFRPPVPYPEMGIRLFNHSRSICEASKVPYILENVAGAQKYVGKSSAHCGSYHLWGSGIPPILPQGIRKGLTELAMGLREHKGKPGWDNRHGQLGRTPAAKVATIPPELANCVADYAERLLEGRAA